MCLCLSCLYQSARGSGRPPPTLLRDGRGRCCIKEGHLSGVRARTNNNPRPLSFCREFVHKHIVCSPSFCFSLPVCVRKWMPAIVAHRAVCVRGMHVKKHAEANKESPGGSSSFKKMPKCSVSFLGLPHGQNLFLFFSLFCSCGCTGF